MDRRGGIEEEKLMATDCNHCDFGFVNKLVLTIFCLTLVDLDLFYSDVFVRHICQIDRLGLGLRL